MRRRLLIRPGAIGDFIVSLPALESLRADYTEVWCAEPNVPLARFADRAISLGSSGIDRLGIANDEDVAERLGRFDDIISWYGESRPEFRKLVSDLMLPFRFLRALPGGDSHAVKFYKNQARSLGALPKGNPRIYCPAVLRSFAAIHPFASSPAKRVPMEIFEGAAKKLSQSMPVQWLCGPEESLAGATRFDNLYDLACHLRGARIFVGNDSGISHLAAAVGTPVTALFISTDPGVWSPRGSTVDAITLRTRNAPSTGSSARHLIA